LNPQEIVADGRTNFMTYQTTVAGLPVTISLYKIGAGNQELALTYTSFVSWTWAASPAGPPSTGGNGFDSSFGIYGIQTVRDLLTSRAGSATYLGVAYGRGAALNGTIYDVSGTSRFDVDFSNAKYTGSLNLRGTSLAGTLTDFGQFTFGANLAAGTLLQAQLAGNVFATGPNQISPQFYGPSGEEIGAGFTLNTGDPAAPTAIGGIAIAKAQ
jgi:hypothetical protein